MYNDFCSTCLPLFLSNLLTNPCRTIGVICSVFLCLLLYCWHQHTSGPFHSTILRKAEFRSAEHRAQYFAMCKDAVQTWRAEGPKPLAPPCTKNIERISTPMTVVKAGTLGSAEAFQSGLWLFQDRNTPTHLFAPNFLPPYDTPEKRAIIYEILSEEWDEATLQWQDAPPLPKPELILPKEVAKKESTLCGLPDMLCGAFDPTYDSKANTQ